jgi:hypothetical protein
MQNQNKCIFQFVYSWISFTNLRYFYARHDNNFWRMYFCGLLPTLKALIFSHLVAVAS